MGGRTGVFLAVAVAVLAVVATGGWALAAQQELGGKLRSGDQVVVPAGEEVTHDLYASGGQITVNGTVAGDLVAAGGQIDVFGTVTGDVLMAGGSLSVAGQVDGDVRASGGQLSVNGEIGEDLLFAGGQATVDGTVGGDLVFGAGQVSVGGDVAGNILGGTGDYARSGTVGGDEQVAVRPAGEAPTAADRVLSALRRFVTVLLVGALLLWLLPGLVRRADDQLVSRPLWSLGGGLLAIVVVALAVVALVLAAVLAVMILGLVELGSLVVTVVLTAVLAVLAVALAFAVAAVFIADAVVGLRLGGLVAGGQPSRTRQLAVMALGLLPVVVLTALPVVGGWIRALVVLFGLGALLLATGVLDRSSSKGAQTGPPKDA